MIKLIKAFRADENTVKVLYIDTDRSQEFLIEWNNVHPETGKIDDYDLQIDCLSSSEKLNEIICNTIRDGEDDNSENIDLYITIRDSFDRYECIDI